MTVSTMRFKVFFLLILMLGLGWVTPGTRSATAADPQTGYIKVNLYNSSTGAQWRRAGTSIWRDNETMEPDVPVGKHTVEFKPLKGYLTPVSQAITIGPNQLTTVFAYYGQAPGALKVTIQPPDAAAAGAAWILPESTVWHSSGETATGLSSTRIYWVAFKRIPGWATAPRVSATVNSGKTTELTATYRKAGSITMTIQPPDAVAAGARWRRVGTTAWRESGSTESSLLSGSYAIEFNQIPFWQSASKQKLTLREGQDFTAQSVYIPARSENNWSTYLDNSSDGRGLALDRAGNIYVAGETSYGRDGFVTKLSATGQHLWSTKLGGGFKDTVYGIAADQTDHVYVAGKTESPGWIMGDTPEMVWGYGTDQWCKYRGFIVKLAPTGSVVWSTYVGGTQFSEARGIAVDSEGNLCVTGKAYPQDGRETFVAKLTPGGQQLWIAYSGDPQMDMGYAIATDPQNNIWVTGDIEDSPFVTKYSPAGQKLWTSRIGSAIRGRSWGIAVDPSGNAFVTGETITNVWASGGYDTVLNGNDAFIAKISPAGNLVWSTYVGGNYSDVGTGIALDAAGNIWATGNTTSRNWTSEDLSAPRNQLYNMNAYLIKLSPSGQQLWSKTVGGLDYDVANALALGPGGRTVLTGYTYSKGWATGGYDTTHNGAMNAFVTVIQEQQAGALRVNLSPRQAVEAGAQWRRIGTTLWHDSATTETNLAPGQYLIEFKPTAGWTEPSNATVRVSPGQTAQVNAAYQSSQPASKPKNAVRKEDWALY